MMPDWRKVRLPSLKDPFSRVGMEGAEGCVTGLARVQRLEDYRRKARFKQVQDLAL